MMPTILLANLKLFQSAPAIAGERDNMCRGPICKPQCFNPRPPLLASVTSVMGWYFPMKLFQSAPAIAGERDGAAHTGGQPPALVSIRARHCWRA